MKRGVNVPGCPGGRRSGVLSLAWAALVSAGRWSWCLVPLSGPLVGSGRLGLSSALVPGSCFFLWLSKEAYCPVCRPKDRFFRQVPHFTARAVTTYLAVGLVVFLQFLIIFLFSVCSDRCRIIQTLRRPLNRLLRQRPFPFDKMFNGPSVIPEGDARAQVVPVETGVVSFFRVEALWCVRTLDSSWTGAISSSRA